MPAAWQARETETSIFQTGSGPATHQISHSEKFDNSLAQKGLTCVSQLTLYNGPTDGHCREGTRKTGGRASSRDPNFAWVSADSLRWGLARTRALPRQRNPCL